MTVRALSPAKPSRKLLPLIFQLVIVGVLNWSVLVWTLSLFTGLFIFSTPAQADNVGITKARLIQKSETSYVVEADVTQALIWAIRAPIFPDRFKVSELEIINQSGWFVVQATATTEGSPLSPEDEILLPWMRNGVDLSVRWIDGTLRQGLFLRSIEGIRVPITTLMQADPSLAKVVREHFQIGLQHLLTSGVHLLLVFVLALLGSPRELFKALLFYGLGQGGAMILAELNFGLMGIELLLADLLGLVLVILLAHTAARHRSSGAFLPLMALFGLLHGLAYAVALTDLGLPYDRILPALFMFNLGIDIGQFLVGLVFCLIQFVVAKYSKFQTTAATVAGALAVALLFISFQDRVITGKTDTLPFEKDRLSTGYSLPASQNMQAAGRPQGARTLTSPIMNYLSVEPFEVRQEILIQARAAVRFLGVDDRGMGSIPVSSQPAVKDGIMKVMRQANPILIDGEPAELILSSAEFVNLGPAGVITRLEPVQESLDNGIIGVTLIYQTPDLADQIDIEWRLFAEEVQQVETTTSDPFGSASVVLSPENNRLEWKSRLSGFKIPVIEEIAIQKPLLPVPSLLLFVCGMTILLVLFLRGQRRLGATILLNCAVMGLVLYPFVRFPVELPFKSRWAPSNERTAVILDGLLTNVYRAFDVRGESEVYDRLALSVTGETLTDIYLQNRRSLELENRGGARASVDEVQVVSVDNVRPTPEGSFLANASWAVSGSVNHFGHTHYRRNFYQALVTFTTDEDAWKLEAFEVLEEKRVL